MLADYITVPRHSNSVEVLFFSELRMAALGC